MALSNTLAQDINKIVDDEVGKYLLEIQETMRLAYKRIVFNSPVITAYYQTNHSITVRSPTGQFKTQGSRLSPGIKDSEERLVYLGNLDNRMSDELVKLTEIALGDSITISTTVPYAEEVEQNHNVYGAVAGAFGLDQS